MTFWEIKYIFEIIPLNRSNVFWFSAYGYIHKHAQFSVTLFDKLSDIPDFPKSLYSVTCVLYSVTYTRWSYLHIKQTRYLKTEVRYATAVKTNLYNFKGFFK